MKSAADIQQRPDLLFSPERPFFQRVEFQSDLFPFCALFLLKDHHDLAALVRPAFFPGDPPIQKRLPFSFVPAMYPRQILEELLRRVILEVSDYTIILRRRKLLPVLVCFHQQGVVNTVKVPFVPDQQQQFHRVIIPVAGLYSLFLFCAISQQHSVAFCRVDATQLVQVHRRDLFDQFGVTLFQALCLDPGILGSQKMGGAQTERPDGIPDFVQQAEEIAAQHCQQEPICPERINRLDKFDHPAAQFRTERAIQKLQFINIVILHCTIHSIEMLCDQIE